jgi:hypothetical protein
VHSSTSSSDSSESGIGRVGRAWRRTWAGVLIAVLLCLGAWEVGWRSRGFRPTVSDDAMLWSLARKQASKGDGDGIVLVGSSRMQMDIHRGTLAATTGWRPAVQLALVRGPARPILENLAEDETFRGTVLCEINPSLFFSDVADFEGEIADYVTAYENFTFFDWVEVRMAIAVRGNLVTSLPQLSPIKIRRAILFRRAPRPRYLGVIGEDRYRYADYRYVPSPKYLDRMIENQLAMSAPKVLKRKAFRERIEETYALADRIAERGGTVIFIRLPSASHVRKREQRFWPRQKWWDQFVTAAGDPARHAAIHFENHRSTKKFAPPDGDHLGKLQAIAFTNRLGKLLVERGLAPGP